MNRYNNAGWVEAIYASRNGAARANAPRGFSDNGDHIPDIAECNCLSCRASRSKQERLKRVAAAMRAYYLTHGKGCKTRALAIARRQGAE